LAIDRLACVVDLASGISVTDDAHCE
jgi:hypothetical protein